MFWPSVSKCMVAEWFRRYFCIFYILIFFHINTRTARPVRISCFTFFILLEVYTISIWTHPFLPCWTLFTNDMFSVMILTTINAPLQWVSTYLICLINLICTLMAMRKWPIWYIWFVPIAFISLFNAYIAFILRSYWKKDMKYYHECI